MSSPPPNAPPNAPPPLQPGDPTSARQGPQPEWRVWSWDSTTGQRAGVSWLGVLLVVIGIALFINQVNRSIGLGSLFLLGLGIAFGAAWLIGGWKGATVPSLLLL